MYGHSIKQAPCCFFSVAGANIWPGGDAQQIRVHSEVSPIPPVHMYHH